jgi:multidrug resistance efflux pump
MSTPAVLPDQQTPKPAAHDEIRPPRRWPWLLLLLVIVGAYVWQSRQKQQAPVAVKGFRTAKVSQGKLENAIRLSGVTGAKNFVTITAPQLRGSRGGFGRGGDTSFSSGVNTTLNVQSNSTPASSGGSSSNSAMDSSGGGGGGRNLSSSLKSATSRSTASSASTAKSSATGGTASAGSSALGSSGIGSTGGALNQQSAMMAAMGGGGGGDFGLILQELAKPGSMIKKGTTVAEFDRQNMLQRLDDYRASVTQVNASFEKLKAELKVGDEQHQQDLDKAKAAVEKARLDMKTLPVLSQMDVERYKLALESAEAKLKQLQAETKFHNVSRDAKLRDSEISVQQTKRELERAELNAERMIIKAPIDGLVVMQSTFRGSEFTQIQQGDQLMPGQWFMSIVDPSSMVVNANVNQVDVERMRIGQKARIKFDAYPDLVLTARVESVGGIPKSGGARATYVKELPVRLKIDQTDPRVIPDLSVAVEILLDQVDSAVLAPLDGVFQDGDAEQPYVFIETPTGWQRRTVQVGIKNTLMAEIRSGVKPGEVIALDRPPDKAAPAGSTS